MFSFFLEKLKHLLWEQAGSAPLGSFLTSSFLIAEQEGKFDININHK
jgi:hypothetical protein